MAYQFIHIETYARQASTKQKPTNKAADGGKSKRKLNVREVIDEATRAPGACPHVETPQPPLYLYGDAEAMQNLELTLERNVEAHEKKTGKKVRKDTHILLAGVVSFPRDLQAAEPATFEKWKSLTLDYLKTKYSDDLKVVLMHDDEAQPHLHFYVHSPDEVNAKKLHDGHAAAAGLPAMTKEYNLAYNAAMRRFQDDYYEQVAHPLGLLRTGPGRQRLSRGEWKARQHEERQRVALNAQVQDAASSTLDDAARELKAATNARKEVERERRAAEAMKDDALTLHADATQLIARYKNANAKLEQEREALDARRKQLEAQERELAKRMKDADEHTHLNDRYRKMLDDKAKRLDAQSTALDEERAVYQNLNGWSERLRSIEALAEFSKVPGALGIVREISQDDTLLDLLALHKQNPDLVRNWLDVHRSVGTFDAASVDTYESYDPHSVLESFSYLNTDETHIR